MFKKALAIFILPFVFLLIPSDTGFANPVAQRSTFNVQRPTAINRERALNSGQSQNGTTGVLQKMIVESGTATMELDLNRLNGITSMAPKFEALRFDVTADSFFSILVFNDLLRGPEQGSMALMPAGVNAPGYSNLPVALNASLRQLAIEKLPSSEQFDLAVRDAKTGFTFFNIEGHQYDYDANAQLLAIVGGRLTISRDLANALGRPSEAGSVVGEISIGAAMQTIETAKLVNGEPKAVVMPPLRDTAGAETPTARVPGPDVIVGDLPTVQQFGSAGTQVGLAVATTSCNNGDQPLDWFQLPNTDHPVIPQNLYRMAGGVDNTERFEQIGQSWLKHAFFALEDTVCSTCNTSNCQTGSHLCPGCSDPYSANLNGDQDQIGSRAWVNPFTGSFPSTANDHGGHSHNGVSHRILVETDDLNTTLNQGASYFAEAQYVTPHEYAWCQAHPAECNMYNNASSGQYIVNGTMKFCCSRDAETAS